MNFYQIIVRFVQNMNEEVKGKNLDQVMQARHEKLLLKKWNGYDIIEIKC